MTLSSLPVLLYLPVVFFGFHALTERFRWGFLLLASYAFYATFLAPHLLLVVALVTYAAYRCGIRLGRLQSGRARRVTFWLGVGGCVLVLVVAKYLPLLPLLRRPDSTVGTWFLFVGVSYYVLQAISYLADVYAGRTRADTRLVNIALYMSFFPKLLQGPIERADAFLPQLQASRGFDYVSARHGLVQYAWGLFKKVVVADRLALFVNPMYADVHSYQGIALLTATYLYGFQLYCDFSGYTDMAIGIGRLFNITLTKNFRAPYLATSIADFWRRWHISLSAWLRDYLYLPVSYSLSKHIKTSYVLGTDANVVIYCSSILVTFVLAGLWHGSAWTYVVWGLLHGIYLAASNLTRRPRKKFRSWSRRHGVLSKPMVLGQMLLTFHLVVLSWVFFRAGKLSDSLYVLGAIAGDLPRCFDLGFVRLQFRGLGLREGDLALAAILLLIVFSADLVEVKSGDVIARLLKSPRWVRWIAYYVLVFCILYLSPYNGAANYIYMRF